MAGQRLWWNACMLLVQAAAGACCQGDSGACSLAKFEAVLTELFPIPAHHAAFDIHEALCVMLR